MEQIIKYSNRKLYSKKESQYVTGSYLADLIKANILFKVVDHKTGDDVTNVVLARVVSTLPNINNTSAENTLKGMIRDYV